MSNTPLRRELIEELDRFFNATQDFLCIVTFDGAFRRVNPRFAEALGYSPEELPAHSFIDPVHEHDVTRTADRLSALREGGDTVTFENRYRLGDGSYRWLQWHATPYPEDGVAYAVARDVTEVKARETDLARAKLEADRANEAKGEFLANVSHEIRTPMNGIIGMTELALETSLTDQQREYLQMVQSSALALLDVINSVLDYSKIEAGKLEIEAIDFTLRDTIAGALKPLALAADKKGLELLYNEGPGIPERLRGDPGRLRQVLVNLIGNAVKFTESGEVSVHIEKVHDMDAGVALRFDVTDTGIGIPEDKLEYIFESFHQADGSTSRRFGGTGLGLSIASGLVEMMGGQIRVDSRIGVGSRFHFTVPFTVGHEAARPPTLPTAELSGLRVLVVDDNETNRRILEGFLDRMDMVYESVGSGAAALESLDRSFGTGAPPHIVILDVHMPEMDGFETARRIREDSRFDDLVLITITSAGRPGDGALCEQLGISSYLLKPIAPTELRDAIQLTLARDADGPAEAPLVTRHSLREAWQSLRVLLAEDNQVNQTLATHLLERLGHHVTLATNGLEVLDALERADFDLVLMDIQMPEMGGVEATRRIRDREAELGGHLPIVAMTAHAMAGDRERFLDVGMDGYISKPISQERLREVVRNVARPPRDAITGGAPAARPEGDRPAEEESSAEAGPEPADTVDPWPFDRHGLMERVDADVDLLRTLVGIFKEDRPSLLSAIEEALLGGDPDALAATAHTIKGALSVFGVEPARSLAEQLEGRGRDGRMEDAPNLYSDLTAAVLAAEAGLDRFLGELE